jgi:hypothetical protein
MVHGIVHQVNRPVKGACAGSEEKWARRNTADRRTNGREWDRRVSVIDSVRSRSVKHGGWNSFDRSTDAESSSISSVSCSPDERNLQIQPHHQSAFEYYALTFSVHFSVDSISDEKRAPVPDLRRDKDTEQRPRWFFQMLGHNFPMIPYVPIWIFFASS